MRDDKEERTKQARSNKQTRQSNTYVYSTCQLLSNFQKNVHTVFFAEHLNVFRSQTLFHILHTCSSMLFTTLQEADVLLKVYMIYTNHHVVPKSMQLQVRSHQCSTAYTPLVPRVYILKSSCGMYMYIHDYVHVHVLMRDENKGRKKQARSNKQQGKATTYASKHEQHYIDTVR